MSIVKTRYKIWIEPVSQSATGRFAPGPVLFPPQPDQTAGVIAFDGHTNISMLRPAE
jgi:hypothetical protein